MYVGGDSHRREMFLAPCVLSILDFSDLEMLGFLNSDIEVHACEVSHVMALQRNIICAQVMTRVIVMIINIFNDVISVSFHQSVFLILALYARLLKFLPVLVICAVL